MTQSLPLLELAKQGYRDVLRDDPQQWDARYNLERALRLAPEAEEGDDGAAPPPLASERAVTTMKGFSLGLAVMDMRTVAETAWSLLWRRLCRTLAARQADRSRHAAAGGGTVRAALEHHPPGVRLCGDARRHAEHERARLRTRRRPVSRLAYAKHLLRQTLADLPCGSRIGWAVFTEYRVLLLVAPVEVCDNYHELIATLDRIDARMSWAGASEVAKGLYWGLRTLKELGGNHGHRVRHRRP